MQKEKQIDAAVLLYILPLLVLVIYNIIEDANFYDLVYLIVLVCCILKYIIINNERK